MYDFNCRSEYHEPKPVGFYRKNKNPHAWGGGRTHRLLIAAYNLAFLCMLWVDEVLILENPDAPY